MEQININGFVRCSCTFNVNDMNNIKVCFWKQTIYLILVKTPNELLAIKKYCIYHLDTIWILLLNVPIFVLMVKHGVVV